MQTQYRSVFISDVHLGTLACQADHLINFLETVQTEQLYLVGDIVDFLQMRKRAWFPDNHRKVISLVLRKAREGTRVVYIPGNHDAFFRQMAGQTISGVAIKRNDVHVTADGRRFFVSHGDEFDPVVNISPALAIVGDHAHELNLRLNVWINRIRRLFGLPYWSLAGFLKSRISKARQYIARFEHAALRASQTLAVDGYICGHIHCASFNRIGDKLYCNDGDWVEHCTALVETREGTLQLLHWSEQPAVLASEPADETAWEGIPATS